MHWCTREHGIIRTVARNARRTGGAFSGKLDLFHSADLVWVPARNSAGGLHTLKEAEVTDFRPGLQHSWTRVLCASYFVRLLESVAEADTPLPSLHHLLHRALDYLAARDPTRKAVLHFERELARDLGVLADDGSPPLLSLRQMLHQVPPQRESLWEALS